MAKELDARLIFKDSSHFFLSNLSQIALLSLPILFCVTALKLILIPTSGSDNAFENGFFNALALDLLAYPLYSGALIVLMYKRSRNETPSTPVLLLAATKIWAPLFIVGLMTTFLIIVGGMLYVLPGIWFLVALSFAEFQVVLERLTPIQAIQASFVATRSHFWIILACLAPVLIPIWAIGYYFDSAIYAQGQSQWPRLMSGPLLSLLNLFANVLVFRIYMLSKSSQTRH